MTNYHSNPPGDGPLSNETVTSYLAAYRVIPEPADPRSATERMAARPLPNVPPAIPSQMFDSEDNDPWKVTDAERLDNMEKALRRAIDAMQSYQHHAELGKLPHELRADLEQARREVIRFSLAMAEGRENYEGKDGWLVSLVKRIVKAAW